MFRLRINRYAILFAVLILSFSVSSFANLINLDSDERVNFIFEPSQSSFLGKGTYKNVYKGKFNDKDVAVVSFNIDNRVDARFDRELNFYRRVQHKNIIKAFAYSEIRKLIVVELALFDLNFFLDSVFVNPGFKKVSSDRFLEMIRFFTDVSEGIKYLHTNRLIHRDIKSNNIVLTKEKSDRLIAKLIDFDYCVKLQRDRPFFIERVSRGTMGYKAPELLFPSFITRMNKDGESKEFSVYKYSFASDVYALGALFFNALSRVPFYSLVIKVAQKYGEIDLGKLKRPSVNSLFIDETERMGAIIDFRRYRKEIERNIVYQNYTAIHSNIFPTIIPNLDKTPLDIAKDKLIGLISLMLSFDSDVRPDIKTVLISLQNIVKTANSQSKD